MATGAMPPPDSAATVPPPDAEGTHEKKAVRAGVFVIGGFGFSQAFRLGGNLLLARLLFPEAFGIMAIANVFNTGLELLSDIGLGPAVIRSDRADEERFLNTAWTLQVIRGFMLWGTAAALSLPLARFYGEPMLAAIVPVIALNSLIGGFRSTSSFSLHKELRQGAIMTIELTKQLVALLVMIGIAYAYRTLWALVIGSIVGTVVKTVWTHFIPSPAKNRFTFDRSAGSGNPFIWKVDTVFYRRHVSRAAKRSHSPWSPHVDFSFRHLQYCPGFRGASEAGDDTRGRPRPLPPAVEIQASE